MMVALLSSSVQRPNSVRRARASEEQWVCSFSHISPEGEASELGTIVLAAHSREEAAQRAETWCNTLRQTRGGFVDYILFQQ